MPDESWEGAARRWITAVGVGATWPDGLRVPGGSGVRMEVEADSHLHVRLDRGGLFLTMRPAARLHRPPLPVTLSLDTVRMGFERGRMQATTSSPTILRPFVDAALSHVLDRHLGHALPRAFRTGDYDPLRDDDLGATMGALGQGLASLAGTAASGTGLPESLGEARDPHVFVQLRVDREWRWPVPDRPSMEVSLASGTLLALHLRTVGPARAARLHALELRAPSSEVIVASTGGSFADALARIAIRRATVHPGPQVQLETRMAIPLFHEEARQELERSVTALIHTLARNLDDALGPFDVPAFLGMASSDDVA